jgi:hypothetical protein
MFCDQKCMNEAREHLHNFECAAMETLYGKVLLKRFEQCFDYRTFAVMISILSESFHAFGSVAQLRTLLEPKHDATILDFDLSSMDENAKQKVELQLFQLMKPEIRNEQEAADEERCRFLATAIFEIEIFDKFIKSEEDRKFMIDYAVQSWLKLSLHRHAAGGIQKYREVSGILLFGIYFNHACDQNVDATFIDNKFVYVVKKPIAKDEQLFTNYSTA